MSNKKNRELQYVFKDIKCNTKYHEIILASAHCPFAGWPTIQLFFKCHSILFIVLIHDLLQLNKCRRERERGRIPTHANMVLYNPLNHKHCRERKTCETTVIIEPVSQVIN